MYRKGDEVHESADEAREAVNVPGMTTVLGVSIVLAIVILSAIWIFWVK